MSEREFLPDEESERSVNVRLTKELGMSVQFQASEQANASDANNQFNVRVSADSMSKTEGEFNTAKASDMEVHSASADEAVTAATPMIEDVVGGMASGEALKNSDHLMSTRGAGENKSVVVDEAGVAEEIDADDDEDEENDDDGDGDDSDLDREVESLEGDGAETDAADETVFSPVDYSDDEINALLDDLIEEGEDDEKFEEVKPKRKAKLVDSPVALSSEPPKAVKSVKSAADKDETPKLAKWIAAHGVCSRRDAEQMIVEGLVKVNGVVVQDVALRVQAGVDRIHAGDVLLPKSLPVAQLFVFHKPRGYVTSAADEEGRPTIYDLLPPQYKGLRYVGRLDFNSEGLLLLTNDGALSRALSLPDNGFPRKYRVRCFGFTEEGKMNRLAEGAIIDGVRYRPAHFSRDETGGASQTWYTVTLTEGKNREIRVMCDYAGLEVTRLIRVEFGPYRLGDLESGKLLQVDPKLAFPDGIPDSSFARRKALAQEGNSFGSGQAGKSYAGRGFDGASRRREDGEGSGSRGGFGGAPRRDSEGGGFGAKRFEGGGFRRREDGEGSGSRGGFGGAPRRDNDGGGFRRREDGEGSVSRGGFGGAPRRDSDGGGFGAKRFEGGGFRRREDGEGSGSRGGFGGAPRRDSDGGGFGAKRFEGGGFRRREEGEGSGSRGGFGGAPRRDSDGGGFGAKRFEGGGFRRREDGDNSGSRGGFGGAPRRDNDGGGFGAKRFEGGGFRRREDGDNSGSRGGFGGAPRRDNDGGGFGAKRFEGGGFRRREDGDNSGSRGGFGGAPRRDNDGGGFGAKRFEGGGFRRREDGDNSGSRGGFGGAPRRDSDGGGFGAKRFEGGGFRRREDGDNSGSRGGFGGAPRRDNDGGGFGAKRFEGGGFRRREDGDNSGSRGGFGGAPRRDNDGGGFGGAPRRDNEAGGFGAKRFEGGGFRRPDGGTSLSGKRFGGSDSFKSAKDSSFAEKTPSDFKRKKDIDE